MESSRWLTVLLIGLVLAGLVVGYFLLRNTFLPGTKPQVQVNQVVQPSASTPPPSNLVLGQNTENLSPRPASAYSRIAARTLGATATLPNTGFPLGLIGIFSTSAMIIGWGLHKYPH